MYHENVNLKSKKKSQQTSSEQVESGTQLDNHDPSIHGSVDFSSVSTNCDPQAVNINVLEALSATGLRAIRYAKECPLVTNIIANDMDSTAAEMIRQNIAHNDVTNKVLSNHGDGK